MAANNDKPLFPPDETMWQKYSPHFEFPLASATSLFLHGFVIGLLAIGGIGFFFTADVEATKPPRMDVVMLEGGGGGIEGGGGEAGLPGERDAGGPKRTELTQFDQPDRPDAPPMPRPFKDELPELGLPLIQDNNAPVSGEVYFELQKIAEEAQRQVNAEMKLPTPPAVTGSAKKPGNVGTGNPKGIGGLGGAGSGLGQGKGKGPGKGDGRPPFGRQATDQEAKAYRWRFDLSGDAKEHARKLAAMGVIIALPDPRGGFVLITDLNRRPVDMKRDSLTAFKDAVKWYNTKQDSVRALGRELQLPFEPKYVVMLLPKEREQKIANEEARFAEANRRPFANIQMTLFDFRFKNGAYDPTVIDQK